MHHPAPSPPAWSRASSSRSISRSPRIARAVVPLVPRRKALFDREVHETEAILSALSGLVDAHMSRTRTLEARRRSAASHVITRFMRITAWQAERRRKLRHAGAVAIQKLVRIRARKRRERARAQRERERQVLAAERESACRQIRASMENDAIIIVQCAWRCTRARNIASKQLKYDDRIKLFHEQRMAALVMQKWWAWRKWALTSNPKFQEKVRRRKKQLRQRAKSRGRYRPRRVSSSSNSRRRESSAVRPTPTPAKSINSSRANKKPAKEAAAVSPKIITPPHGAMNIEEMMVSTPPTTVRSPPPPKKTTTTPPTNTNKKDTALGGARNSSAATSTLPAGKMRGGAAIAARARGEASACVPVSGGVLLHPSTPEHAGWDFQLFPVCKDLSINHDRVLFEQQRGQIVELLQSYDRTVRQRSREQMAFGSIQGRHSNQLLLSE